MFRYRIKERLAQKEYVEKRVITMTEIAEATGIHRVTLSKLANNKGYNPTMDVLDRLCNYFKCRIGDLVEHIADEAEPDQGK